MSIRSLNIEAKTAITLFLILVITATISSVILLGLTLSGQKEGLFIPSITQIKNKYATPELVASMMGSMNEYVTYDEDIQTVQEWIKNGAKKDESFVAVEKIISLDCANCHSKSSKMSKAIPSLPLENYEQIRSHTQSGYSWKGMSKQAHIHLYGISLFLIIITVIFAYSTYPKWLKMALIVLAFGAAFLDIFSWWFSKYSETLIYLIYFMGAVMVSATLLISLLILLDIYRSEVD